MSAAPAGPADQIARSTNPVPPVPGLKGAFHIMLDHMGSHLELLKLEAGQELSRLGKILGLWAGIVLTLQLTLTLVTLVTIAWLWDTPYRLPAIIISMTALLLLTALLWSRLKRLQQTANLKFAVSSQQWQRDIEVIKGLL